MGDLPDDLRTVIAVWHRLPGAVKAGIVAMVHTAETSTLGETCRRQAGVLVRQQPARDAFRHASALSVPARGVDYPPLRP
jgi:hypothetical protein